MQVNYRKFSAGASLAALLLAGGICAFPAAAGATEYLQTDLVTDDAAFLASQGYPAAAHVDSNLINPWGVSYLATSPFWISDNGADKATLYSAAGVPSATVVGIPPGANGPPAGPTGQVANIGGANDFKVTGTKSNFIFATESGTISAWRGGLTSSVIEVDNSAAGAVYKGLAIGNSASGLVLYAANFGQGRVDVFDNNFAPTTLAGNFADPTLPAGYAPFNVQVLNGTLYVTYALQDGAKHDDVAGAGNGIVDQYSLNGGLIGRVASAGVTPGDAVLNSPWGLDIAPIGFGQYSGDLLVGNFGDGFINVFNPTTDAFLGTLDDGSGNPLQIDGLWELINGNGGAGVVNNAVYFTAGIGDEEHGLFGFLSPIPEPASLAVVLGGLTGLGALRRRRRTAVSLA